MKSLDKLRKDNKITLRELCEALRDCVSYHLSDEELEPFLVKVIEKYYVVTPKR